MKVILALAMLLVFTSPLKAETLNWLPVPGAVNYVVQQNYNGSCNQNSVLAIVTCEATTCSYTGGTPSPDQQTWWLVSAKDANGKELEVFIFGKHCPTCPLVSLIPQEP